MIQEPNDSGEETVLGGDNPQALVTSSQQYQREASVSRAVWVSDDISCLLEATPPTDPIGGGETSTHDGLDNVKSSQFYFYRTFKNNSR